MILFLLATLLLAALAAANGANDVSKGVATLAGSGLASYRSAVLWGAATTLAGSLFSGLFAQRMLKLFTSGIVSAKPTATFTLAVIVGAAGWVAIASLTRLPVSTTHAIIGSLIGAGSLFAPGSVVWASLLPRLASPLLLSIVASYVLSSIMNRLFAARAVHGVNCICVTVLTLDAGAARFPQLAVLTGTTAECSALTGGALMMTTEKLHWIASGAVGFARGLNDTPKMVAIGGVLVGARMSPAVLLLIVSAAMGAGSLSAGRRVARVLAEKVVRMDHREGFMASLATATLVGAGATLGLPMSTTHVATGAIAGIAGADTARLQRRTVRDLAIAWTVTPLVAGLIAAGAYLLVSFLLG